MGAARCSSRNIMFPRVFFTDTALGSYVAHKRLPGLAYHCSQMWLLDKACRDPERRNLTRCRCFPSTSAPFISTYHLMPGFRSLRHTTHEPASPSPSIHFDLHCSADTCWGLLSNRSLDQRSAWYSTARAPHRKLECRQQLLPRVPFHPTGRKNAP